MERHVLVVSERGQERKLRLKAAASDARCELDAVATTHQARTRLGESGVDAILVDADLAGGGALCVELRSQAEFSQVPILLACREVDELTFAEALAWGVDDVIAWANAEGLTRRLRTLPSMLRQPPPSGRGLALLADLRDDRRIVLGRLLRNAGYSVVFATNETDARRYAADRRCTLIVESATMVPDQRAALLHARGHGSTAVWIATSSPKCMPALQEALAGFEQAAVADGFAPVENVLFVANELLAGQGTNQRASQRLLYGTTIKFREAGHEHDDCGYSYNVSRTGLYVRTLAPPPGERVWLELRPPRSERWVRLEGRIAWRRLLGPVERATVPPGFGVAVTDGSQVDLDCWHEGCRRFEASSLH